MRQLNLAAAVLDPLLRTDASKPRFTYYDDATGERIELSTATFANWAAKTGNLLRDELGAVPGSRVAVLLPAHWQTAAVVFGVWWIGGEVVVGDAGDIALCTVDRLDDAGGDEVVVLSLDPFGKPAADVPPGVTDYATSVRVQADQIAPERQPGPALGGLSGDEVYDRAIGSAEAEGISAGDRILSTADWDTDVALVDGLVAVYAVGASLVQVAHPDPSVMDRRRETEKVTRVR